jgi:hypothetical protein
LQQAFGFGLLELVKVGGTAAMPGRLQLLDQLGGHVQPAMSKQGVLRQPVLFGDDPDRRPVGQP